MGSRVGIRFNTWCSREWVSTNTQERRQVKVIQKSLNLSIRKWNKISFQSTISHFNIVVHVCEYQGLKTSKTDTSIGLLLIQTQVSLQPMNGYNSLHHTTLLSKYLELGNCNWSQVLESALSIKIILESTHP